MLIKISANFALKVKVAHLI